MMSGTGTSTSNQMMDLMKANMMMNSKDNPIWTFMLLTFFEVIVKYVSQIIDYLKQTVDKYVQRRMKDTMTVISDNVSMKEEHDIIFERKYGSKQKADDNVRVDALLCKLSQLSHIKKMIYARSTYMVNYNDVIEIEDGIKFQLLMLEQDNEGDVGLIKFRIFTDVGNAVTLKKYVEKCEIEYEIRKKNRLGDDVYYFDHVLQPKDMSGRDACEDKVIFTRNLFITNRTIDNVFFEAKEEVKTRLNLFMHKKSWYDKRGIPYTLGLMLYGVPGAGKTSLCKALANETKRHIISVNFSKLTTKRQLKQLFYDERIWVMEKADVGENLESYVIPIHKRLYLIEDIDCVEGELLMKRHDEDDDDEELSEGEEPIGTMDNTNKLRDRIARYRNGPSIPTEPKEPEINGFMSGMTSMLGAPLEKGVGNRITPGFNTTTQSGTTGQNAEAIDKIDLSAVLNVLDGTLETPGRMLIITSNYPEKLDEALVRPGRIDMMIEFKKASRKIIGEMYRCFYEDEADPILLEKIDDYKWTPAEVGQIMFKNYNTPREVLVDLAEKDPSVYFKFSHFEEEEGDEPKPKKVKKEEIVFLPDNVIVDEHVKDNVIVDEQVGVLSESDEEKQEKLYVKQIERGDALVI